ncbi:kinase-like protein [Sistotremastrum suecicum HHB10207 ss-3]|uniref:Kinase-like protein n=1 Tax=Sistotremastrum suecicum HHB10207 ss-3 TaxID=1314776 RepID=A0A166BIG8_9AGAM|nr:kinase-like protein [Sistotremastrum suecicum HHB10207 ss-3]
MSPSGIDIGSLNHIPDSTLDLTNNIIYRDAYRHPVAMGGQSDIYRADVNGISIAVKVMREIGVDTDRQRRHLAKKIDREMRLWSKVDHGNILAFLGFCFFPNVSHAGGSAQLSLVSPWMKNGTAIEYARNKPDTDRISIIRGVINGIRHLHDKLIVHGDIKGGNVLMTDDGVPVLADFGLATLVENDPSLGPTHEMITSTTTASLRGTPRWMAPELLMSESQKSNNETDVWAFGCFVLELITLAVPYSSCRTDVNAMAAIMRGRLPYDFTPHPPNNSVPTPFQPYPNLWALCLRCWETNIPQRITVPEILTHESLRTPVRSTTIPITRMERLSSYVPSTSTPNAPAPARRSATEPNAIPTASTSANNIDDLEILALEARIRIKKRSLGPEDPETLDQMHDLSCAYHSLGRYEEAERIEMTVLEIRRRVQGDYHPATLISMHHLALQYYSLFKLEQSEKLGLETIEAMKQVFEDENAAMLMSMYNLGLTYQLLGQFPNAEEWFRKSFEGRKRIFGLDDKATLFAAHGLMIALSEGGRLTNAAEVATDLVERRRRTLGDGDLETRKSMEEYMVILIKLGRKAEAAELEDILSTPQ